MAELNNTSSGQWSETDASNTSPSPDGWPSGTFLNQAEPIGRSTMGAIKRFWDRINGTVTSTGSSNAYVYTPSNTSYPTAYVTGEKYTFKANFANTGAATININSLGAKNIFKQGTSGPTALTGGEIQSGQLVTVAYDGTQMQIISDTPFAIGTGGISTAMLADNAVTTVKITDANVTTAKIANANVTLAKIANASANSKLLGSGTSGSGSPYAELSLGTGLSMSGTTLNATGGFSTGTATNLSGTTTTISGVPSTAKSIKVSFSAVSTSGTSIPGLLVTVSGSPISSGYAGTASTNTSAAPACINMSSIIPFGDATSSTAAAIRQGVINFELIGSNTWAFFGSIGYSNEAREARITGSITLAGAIDGFQFTTQSADTFDGGTGNWSAIG